MHMKRHLSDIWIRWANNKIYSYHRKQKIYFITKRIKLIKISIFISCYALNHI